MQKIFSRKYGKLEGVLPHIVLALSCAQQRIYSTHLLAKEEDRVLPYLYLNALRKSTCTERIRIVFGDRSLYHAFVKDEQCGFCNLYTASEKYQRLLLIDDCVFYRVDGAFFHTNNPHIIQQMFEYFSNIPTI